MKKIIAIIGFLGIFTSQAVFSFAGYFNTDPIVRCGTYITKTLQIGSENKEVYTLQVFLSNAGFLGATPNGYFGSQTASAVRAFQAYSGIRQTGTVGEVTRNALNESLCDTGSSFSSFGEIHGLTYVGKNDPYVQNVQVIMPQVSAPAVYATPQSLTQATVVNREVVSAISSFSPSSQIIASGIVYNPATGYSYGIVPRSGSLTVSSPVANAVYQEGDTVRVSWTTDNLAQAPYTISLESSITGQSKVVAVVGDSTYSFVLSKELLDAVCSGTCNNTQNGSFRIVVSVPTTDIAGISSVLRAAVAPITIKRPISVGQVSIVANKSPVNSGEIFRLYVNIPSSLPSWLRTTSETYSIKLKATCLPSVTVSIAGTPCGQEFAMPYSLTSTQQEIPVGITNISWYKQEVVFSLVVTDSLGKIVGVGETKVTVNAAPFSW